MCDVSIFTAARSGDRKTPPLSWPEIIAERDLLLSIAHALGYSFARGNRVLDFGCGIGGTVQALLHDGFDAYGVDVGEWWGRDHPAYWHDSPIPSDQIRSRLSTTNEAHYRLPYPDNYFDLILSSQVFEHVFNYESVFRELARVMKPDGVSIHVFPGRGTPIEPHVFVPFIPLAKKDWWLRLWALVARRHRPGWRAEFEYLRDHMRSNNYPSRAELCASAAAAGANISFREDLYIEAKRGSRPWKILKQAERLHIAWVVSPVIQRICQRAMVISKVHHGS